MLKNTQEKFTALSWALFLIMRKYHLSDSTTPFSSPYTRFLWFPLGLSPLTMNLNTTVFLDLTMPLCISRCIPSPHEYLTPSHTHGFGAPHFSYFSEIWTDLTDEYVSHGRLYGTVSELLIGGLQNFKYTPHWSFNSHSGIFPDSSKY